MGHPHVAYLKKRLDKQRRGAWDSESDAKKFKLEAVILAPAPDQTFTGVSINPGISDSSLHRWVKEFERQGKAAFPGHGQAGLTAEQAEIKRLQRELDIARQERDVLRGAGRSSLEESEVLRIHRRAPTQVPLGRHVPDVGRDHKRVRDLAK